MTLGDIQVKHLGTEATEGSENIYNWRIITYKGIIPKNRKS